MNQSKFSLADVLTLLSVLVFSFVSFLGANFLNINEEKVWGMSYTTGCIMMAVFVFGLLFATAYGARLFKRATQNFKTNFIFEILFILLFVLFAIFFTTKSSPFVHYFTVNGQKSEINSKLQTSISQAEELFSNYENYADNRKKLYENKLRSVVKAKGINPKEYSEYGFKNNGVSVEIQINKKMFTVNADLFPTNYSDTVSNKGIKEVATKWLKDSKEITNSWKPIGVVGVVKNVEKNSTEWLNTLVALSKVREQGEQANDFVYSLAFNDVKSNLSTPKSPTPASIIFAVVAYVFMMFSWFVTYRSSKSKCRFKHLLGLLFPKKNKEANNKYNIKY